MGKAHIVIYYTELDTCSKPFQEVLEVQTNTVKQRVLSSKGVKVVSGDDMTTAGSAPKILLPELSTSLNVYRVPAMCRRGSGRLVPPTPLV